MNIDLNDLSPDEILELAYALLEDGEGMEKDASEEIDLNDLTVDEFLDFAEGLEEEMIKTAGPRWDAVKAGAEKAGSRVADAFKASRFRRARGVMEGEWGLTGDAHKALRRKEMAKGLAEAGAAYGGAGVAGVGTYKGIQALRNRNKKKR